MFLYYIRRAREKSPGTKEIVMDAQHLKLARDRLDRFSLVLLTERLGDAGPLLEARFGWTEHDAAAYRAGTHSHTVATPTQYQAKPLDVLLSNTKLRDQLLKQTELDRNFYNHAEDIFDKQLRLLQNGTAGNLPAMETGQELNSTSMKQALSSNANKTANTSTTPVL